MRSFILSVFVTNSLALILVPVLRSDKDTIIRIPLDKPNSSSSRYALRVYCSSSAQSGDNFSPQSKIPEVRTEIRGMRQQVILSICVFISAVLPSSLNTFPCSFASQYWESRASHRWQVKLQDQKYPRFSLLIFDKPELRTPTPEN